MICSVIKTNHSNNNELSEVGIKWLNGSFQVNRRLLVQYLGKQADNCIYQEDVQLILFPNNQFLQWEKSTPPGSDSHLVLVLGCIRSMC